LRVASGLGDDEVVVLFEDTGEGISPAAMPHLYEPYFTTKANTGLGLFVSHRIVTGEFGGTLTAESEPGGGARFTVRLPVRSRSAADNSASS
jgi:signal transduction histidine kinase